MRSWPKRARIFLRGLGWTLLIVAILALTGVLSLGKTTVGVHNSATTSVDQGR